MGKRYPYCGWTKSLQQLVASLYCLWGFIDAAWCSISATRKVLMVYLVDVDNCLCSLFLSYFASASTTVSSLSRRSRYEIAPPPHKKVLTRSGRAPPFWLALTKAVISSLLQLFLAFKKPVRKWNPGKWKHGPTPAYPPPPVQF